MHLLTTVLSTLPLISTASSQFLVAQNPPHYAPHAPNLSPLMSSNPITSKTQQVPRSDLLGRNQRIQIFAGLIRDVDSVSALLEDASKNSTVLAPENAAIQRLPRKPWEDADDYKVLGDDAYAGAAGKDRADGNLRRFVQAHVVPQSPWVEGEKVETVGGQEVWWETKGGKAFIQPGNIEVLDVTDKAANGEVWVLKEALNYPK